MTAKITGEQIGELTGLGIILTTLGIIYCLRYLNPDDDKPLSRKEKRDKRRAQTSDAAMAATLAHSNGTVYTNPKSESAALSARERATQNNTEARGVKHKKIKKISKRTHTKSKNNKSRRK
jgi:hypothetical protein